MRKITNAFRSTKRASSPGRSRPSSAAPAVEWWTLGQTDAVAMNMLKPEGEENPSTVVVQVVPPQSSDRDLGPACGAYCLVIDVSYSMSHEAQITTDEGEKQGFGWSLLDIAKHATSTFISTLGDADFVTIVTYSSAVKIVQEWIKCDAAGKATALRIVGNMKPEVETNLSKGLVVGFDQMSKLPVPPRALHAYALHMVVLTDGRPTPEYHPGEGVAWRSIGDQVMPRDVDCSPAIRGAYIKLLRDGQAALSKKSQLTRTMVTSIGLGNDLDSPLLAHMSDAFLHIPDPGSVGAFMVNLIAQLRSTARLPDPAEGASAGDVTLLVTPASAVKAVPGYLPAALGHGPPASQLVELPADATSAGEAGLQVPLGTMALDQPRHVLLELVPNAPPVKVRVMLHGQELASNSTDFTKPVPRREIEVQRLRLLAVEALEKLGSVPQGAAADPRPLEAMLDAIDASPAKDEPAVAALATTLRGEVALGVTPDNFGKWGRHYVRTLPMVLRAERRNNFRDAATQGFGKDAHGRDGLFESISNEAELAFATLPAPTPSIKKTGSALPAQPAANNGTQLPAEFLRAGGCFAPHCAVQVLRTAAADDDADADDVDDDGGADGGGGAPPGRATRVDQVRAGDVLATAGGGAARVRCVVRLACPGGAAELVRLRGGAELTAWHPVLLRDAAGGARWRFPAELGVPAVRPCPCVYNFVLEADHVLLVNGVGCATLGHGLAGAVVGHAYYGTDAVLRDLRRHPGWASGHVDLAEPLLPPAA